MVIAALICFVVLAVAWVLAPDGQPAAHVTPAIEPELGPAGA